MAPKKIKTIAGPDADEVEAVEAAAAVLQSLSRMTASEAKAAVYAVVSTWILERVKRQVGRRLSDNIVFDLQDAQIVGQIEALLPKIGDALSAANFPFEATFNDLTRQQAVMLFVAGAVAHREALVLAGEDPNLPFSDPIPFGD